MPNRFYDGQRGPDIRRELNNLEAVFDDAIANARGPQGWAPVVSVVTDGARRVLRLPTGQAVKALNLQSQDS